MLDVVLVLITILLTTVTLLYAAGCDTLLRTDSTRDSSLDAPLSPITGNERGAAGG